MSSYVMEVVRTDRNEETFLSLSETARLLNVSERTIHRWIQDGRLPAYKPGRAYRFRMSDIEAFLEERRGVPLAEREPTLFNGVEAERRIGLGSLRAWRAFTGNLWLQWSEEPPTTSAESRTLLRTLLTAM